MMRSFQLTVALTLLLAGCDGEPFVTAAITPLEDAVLGIDPQTDRARIAPLTADGVGDGLELEVGVGALTAQPRPGAAGEAVLFSSGRVGDAEEPPVDAEVVLVDRTGERGRWTLDGPYTRFQLDPEGRYGMASDPFGRLAFENRVEVVDLAAPGSPSVPLSLRSLGGEVPEAAAFSDPLPTADGDPLRLVALFAAGQLSLFDLDAPDLAPVTVPTSAAGAGSGPTPAEALFVGRELVVRTSRGQQLLVITLNDVIGVGGQRFDPSIRTLATDGPPQTLLVDRRSTPPRLLALAGATLHVFDLDAGSGTEVRLPSALFRMLPFDGPAPNDPTVRPRLLVYSPGRDTLVFVDLGHDADQVLSESTVVLSDAPTGIAADPVAGRLVLFRNLGGGPTSFEEGSWPRTPTAVFDLFDRSATPVTALGVDRAVLASGGRALWIAGTGDGYLARLDLDDGTLEETFIVDDRITSLAPVAGDSGRVLVFLDRPLTDRDEFLVFAPGALEADAQAPRGRVSR